MSDKKLVNVGEVIDSAKFFPVPFCISLMMVVIMLIDGFDLFTMGYIGPHLLEPVEAGGWGISRTDLGPVNSAGLIGMAIGSVGLGWLGDRVGRKRAYVTCLFFLFAGSMLCYHATGLADLTLWRGVTGLGLGGVTPLATTLIAEWTNKRVRSVVVACVIVSIPLGGTLAGVVEQTLIANYGWRSMFLVGAVVPLILVVLFSYTLPESPKYMAQRPSEHGRLAKALNRLVGENRFDGTENFVVVEAVQHSRHWFATIWNSHYRRSTLLIWIAFAVNSFVLYLFTNYLRVLLEAANQSSVVGSRGLALFSLGAFFGSIGGAFLIGGFGSRWIGTLLALLGTLAAALIALALGAGADASAFQLLTFCLLAGMSVNGMQAFMYAVSAHSYPTEIRASAVGMAQTFSRVGAVLSPTSASIYFAMDPLPPAGTFFLFIAAVTLITVVSFFLIPTHIPRHKDSATPVEAEAS